LCHIAIPNLDDLSRINGGGRSGMLEFRREEFVVGDIVHSLVPEEVKKRNLSLCLRATREVQEVKLARSAK